MTSASRRRWRPAGRPLRRPARRAGADRDRARRARAPLHRRPDGSRAVPAHRRTARLVTVPGAPPRPVERPTVGCAYRPLRAGQRASTPAAEPLPVGPPPEPRRPLPTRSISASCLAEPATCAAGRHRAPPPGARVGRTAAGTHVDGAGQPGGGCRAPRREDVRVKVEDTGPKARLARCPGVAGDSAGESVRWRGERFGQVDAAAGDRRAGTGDAARSARPRARARRWS